MNAPLEHPAVLAPRWRGPGFLRTLGPAYWSELPAQPLPEVHWVARNDPLAAELGLADWLRSDACAAGARRQRRRAAGQLPLASVYSGHQFGVWAGQLGDGRAIMLGEIDTPAGRAGDPAQGRGPHAVLAHGRRPRRAALVDPRVPLQRGDARTSASRRRARCAVIGSPAPVLRENVETAAVVTRVAPSFLRFGHFEHFAHHGRRRRAARRWPTT